MSSQQTKQRIWLKNTRLATFGGGLLILMQVYAFFTGRSVLSGEALVIILLLFSAGCAVFVFLISSGKTIHLRDGSLTLQQMVWATSSTILFMGLSSIPDELYYFLLFTILGFGVFRLAPADFYRFALFSSLAVGFQKVLVLLLGYSTAGLLDEFFVWLMFSASMLILAVMFSVFIPVPQRFLIS